MRITADHIVVGLGLVIILIAVPSCIGNERDHKELKIKKQICKIEHTKKREQDLCSAKAELKFLQE